MAEPTSAWPQVPPEVPPPRRPDGPEEPAQPSVVPPLPVVPYPGTAHRCDEAWALLERRIVLLFGPLDHAAATRAAAHIMTLDAEDDSEIRVHLSCEHAELLAALTLAETIELARSPVVGIAQGVVAGAALAILCAAGRRLAAPRALLRLCEPQHSVSGAAQEISVRAQELRRHVDQLHAWIAAVTGQPAQAVAGDMQRGRLLDAAAAVDYGLIDDLLQGRAGQDR